MIWIDIDRKSRIPLGIQVYKGLKGLILDGRIAACEKLPSTRKLSKSLCVSRNCVIEAYEQLFAEGYVESRHGSGTRVAEGISYTKKEIVKKSNGFQIPVPKEDNSIIDFRSGVPALDKFPLKAWKQSFYDVCAEMKPDFLDYGQPEGRKELREVLADYLYRVRGIQCNTEQILITSGATQGISLVARLLFKPDAKAIIEDPASYGLHRVISSCGYTIQPADVDQYGIITDHIYEHEKAELIYVTPSHQFPLGGTLSIQRRLELIKFAQKAGSFIIEDDYDSEFRFEGYPVSALYSLDPDRVIYIGTFSKILSPALRLGYVILPHSLLKKYRSLKRYSDVHTGSLEQLVLAHFIKGGQLERHVSKMKKLYFKRQQALIDGLKTYFPQRHIVSGNSTGLHLITEFPGLDISEALLKKASESGIKVYPVDFHAIQKGRHNSKIIMGYGHLAPEKISEGLLRLSKVF